MVKTSASHPLRIDEVAVPGVSGVLGLTFCPGKKQPLAATGTWDRDLGHDLDAVAAWGATMVLTVLEDRELEELGVTALAAELRRRGIVGCQLRIPDGGIPGKHFEDAWKSAGPEVRARLLAGERLLVHCKGGLGRTGTVAGRILVEMGLSSDEAVLSVRRARPGTIENDLQEQYVRRLPRPGADQGARPRREDRTRGCLLAGACGDALGAPVEFLDLATIRKRYGPQGIRSFDSAYGRVGAITDDTQMTLFTAEGCIRAWVRGTLKGICHPPSVVHHAYLRWLTTQGETTDSGLAIGMDGWLVGLEGLRSRRAPGNTCLSALRASRSFGQRAANDSKGCGGVMRMAPVGLIGLAGGAEGAFELGCEAARVTHGHPSGYLAAGFQAALIALLVAGTELKAALDEVSGILKRHDRHEEVLRSVALARELAPRGPSPERVARLGQGWVAEEALGISLFCALSAPDLESAVRLAVNHSGDSDSTGAITGNLVGAVAGARAIPGRWLEQLELRAEIESLAVELAAIASASPPDAGRLWDRYPGW